MEQFISLQVGKFFRGWGFVKVLSLYYFVNFELICKVSYWTWSWCISASSSALTSALTSALQKNSFFLWRFYFWLSKLLMKKTSMLKSLSSTPAHVLGSFVRSLEQLFCRKPVGTCFCRSFKNTHSWKLQFCMFVNFW